jgi:hypothetical protein
MMDISGTKSVPVDKQALQDLETQIGSADNNNVHGDDVRGDAKEKLAANKESVLGTLKDATTKGVQVLSDRAVEVSQQAKQKVKEGVSSGREALTTTLEDTANVVRKLGQDTQSPLLSSLTPYSERAGNWIDETSKYLNEVTPQRVIKDVRSLARNNPALFIGGALALGLLGSRFLKSATHASQAEGGYGDN